MLGKLMKYEWKATWKLLLPINLFIVLMTFLCYITVKLSFFESDSELVIMTGTMIIVAYIISLFVVSIGTMIYLIYRFYISVYGDQGYLLHTLPVDKHHIIIAKSFVSAAWVVINGVLMYVSVISLFSMQTVFMETMKEAFDFYVKIANETGIHVLNGFDIFMTFVASLAAVIARILKITACISLGQLAPNHKVLSAFGFYYGIYFIQRIFEMIYYTIVFGMMKNTGDLNLFFNSSWEFTLISSLIYCVVFYFLTWYVMDKKLNLD